MLDSGFAFTYSVKQVFPPVRGFRSAPVRKHRKRSGTREMTEQQRMVWQPIRQLAVPVPLSEVEPHLIVRELIGIEQRMTAVPNTERCDHLIF